MGEVAAAVIAGALSLADGVKVISVRSTLLSAVDGTGGNGMAVVDMSADEFSRWSAEFPGVGISVYASPSQCTIGGPVDQVKALAERVESLGRDAWVLKVAGAAHSPEVDQILDELTAQLAGVTPQPAAVPFYSTVSRDPREVPAFDNAYWGANARQPVRFTQAIAAAAEDGHDVFLEISPHPVATANITRTLGGVGRVKNPLVLSSLRRDTDDAVTFALNAARLHVRGFAVQVLPAGATGRFVDLPTTAWRNERFWFTPPKRPAAVHGNSLVGTHVELPEGGRHLWSNPIGDSELAGLEEARAFAVSVVPTSFFAEVALTAAAEALGRPVTDLVVTGLERPAPLTRAEHTELTTSYTTTDGALEIFGRANKRSHWTLVARATVRPAGPDSPTIPDSIGDPVSVDAPQNPKHNPLFSARATVLDALLRALVADTWTGPGDVIDRVGTLRVLGDLSAGGRLLVGSAEGVRTAWLLDAAGALLAVAADAAIRGLRRDEVVVPSARLFYSASMRPSPLPSGRAARPAKAPAGTWLLIDSAVAPQLADRTVNGLREGGHDVRVADSGSIADELSALSTAGVEIAGVVLFAAKADDAEHRDPVANLDRDREQIMTLGRVSSSLTEQSGSSTARLWVAVTGAVAVLDGEAGRPGQFALRSAVRTLSIEQSIRRATLIDCDPDGDGSELLLELLAGHVDDEVAWRKGDRYAMRFGPASLPEAEQTPIRDGAYIVSGGLGGIGIVIGKWLADNGASRVLLTSRHDASAEQQADFSQWNTDVRVVPGDINDPQTAQRLVQIATEGGMPLRGVAHLAGAPLRDSLYQDLAADDLAVTWTTKIRRRGTCTRPCSTKESTGSSRSPRPPP